MLRHVITSWLRAVSALRRKWGWGGGGARSLCGHVAVVVRPVASSLLSLPSAFMQQTTVGFSSMQVVHMHCNAA